MEDNRMMDVDKNLLSSVPVEIIVSVGKARPMVRDLLSLSRDSVLSLDRRIDDPVELYVGGKLIARGELTDNLVGKNGILAVRITEIVDLRDEL